jgi:hypothetical protein
MIYLLFRLLPLRTVTGLALLIGGLHFAGVDLLGYALDLLGIPEWSWNLSQFW